MVWHLKLDLNTEGADTRPVLGIVTDDLGDQEILLCYSDIQDWGLLCEHFPRLPKTTKKVKKVSTSRKNIRLPVAKKTSPVKAPRKKTIPDPRRGVSVIQSSDFSPRVEEPQISPSMSREHQKEAEELTNYIQAEFPDVFREKLGREDQMAFDPVELIVVTTGAGPRKSLPTILLRAIS